MIEDCIEKNTLIARYMGYEEIDNDFLLSFRLPQFDRSDNGEWCQSEIIGFYDFWKMDPSSLRYDKSWDWIMPVIDKIESNKDCIFTIRKRIEGGYECSISYTKEGVFFKNVGEIKLDIVWITVCDFVEWSNKK